LKKRGRKGVGGQKKKHMSRGGGSKVGNCELKHQFKKKKTWGRGRGALKTEKGQILSTKKGHKRPGM